MLYFNSNLVATLSKGIRQIGAILHAKRGVSDER